MGFSVSPFHQSPKKGGGQLEFMVPRQAMRNVLDSLVAPALLGRNSWSQADWIAWGPFRCTKAKTGGCSFLVGKT